MPGGVEPTTHYNDTTGDWTRNLHLERVMCLTYSTMVPNNGINITKKYFFLVCILNIEWSANSIETRNINTAMFFADILVSIPCTVFSVLPLPLSIAACRTNYYCPCTTPEDSRFQYFFKNSHKPRLFYLYERSERVSNPWPLSWQASVLTSWTTGPMYITGVLLR